jgi:2-polyprenyl-6-methoxyphenol hydroxylase-like FAD-dependent oxidoreductase
MSTNRRHAVVLGAGIGGLLAARVLSDAFATVDVYDRDALPTGPAHRKGVPHDVHLHGLLARGRAVLDELFPGATGDLAARGAIPVDMQRDFVWYPNGNLLPRAESGLNGLCVSRPGLEAYLRERVLALPNVTVHQRQRAIGLTAGPGGAVDGVRLEDREVSADLVVDATGRGSRAPAWLAELGFDRPVEEGVDTATVYVTRDYRRRPGDTAFLGAFMGPSPQKPYGGFAIAVEGDRWMTVLLGVGPGQAPPVDPDGFRAFATKLSGPQLSEVLDNAEPLEPPKRLRLPASLRRRYERIPRNPEGFLAFGDALCAFNPSYAQGISVAAVQATVLRHCLRAGSDGLPRRFYTRAAKMLDAPWEMGMGNDVRYAHVDARPSHGSTIIGRYVDRVTRAAARHPAVARRFLAVGNLMASPAALFAPAVLARALAPAGRGTQMLSRRPARLTGAGADQAPVSRASAARQAAGSERGS